MEKLFIFTRYPEPGHTKTRLIPALGAEGAANLHRQMAESILATAQQLSGYSTPPLSIDIRYTGCSLEQMQNWLGQDLTYTLQGIGDLGERLIGAFSTAFAQGQARAVAIGTDCPSVTVEILTQAFEQLQRYDVVLGPARDGGYYLVGLKQSVPQLFQGIDWGTERVFQQTVEICQQLQLDWAQLSQLTDIDRPEDLSDLPEDLKFS